MIFFKKRVAPATQDATLPADEIRVGEKVCFFCKFLQGISKKKGGKEKYRIEGEDGHSLTIEMKKEGEPFNPKTIEEALNFKIFTDEIFFWFLKNVEVFSIAIKGFALKLIFQNKKIIKRQLKDKLPEKVEDKVLLEQKS